jgi:hypothetical protein
VDFSEHLNQANIERGVQLFPRFDEELKIKYRGDRIIIYLPEELDSSQTYILTLDRDITDEHNVPMDKTVQLAYSTGSTIHSGAIAGNIPSGERLAVHLWKLSETPDDSLFATIPDYVTDVNEDGNYEFNFLAPGAYRVLSIGKELTGLPLDTRLVHYGLFSSDPIVVNTLDTVSNVDLLVRQELPELRFLRGDWDSPYWGKLEFNRPISRSQIELNFEIQIDGSSIIYPEYFIDPDDSTSIILLSDEPVEGEELLLTFDSLRDTSGILIDSGMVNIQLDIEDDTSFVKITSPKSNRAQIAPELGNKPELQIIFSKPLNRISREKLALTVYNSDTTEFPTILRWNSPRDLTLKPLNPWESNNTYFVEIFKSQIEALDGTTIEDSVTVIDIRTLRKIGYGRLLGSVLNLRDNNLVAQVKALKKPRKQFAGVVISQAGFELDHLPENSYSLILFEDRNNDLKYDYGNAYPFKPSEWFYWIVDTIDIRANWDFVFPPIDLEK